MGSLRPHHFFCFILRVNLLTEMQAVGKLLLGCVVLCCLCSASTGEVIAALFWYSLQHQGLVFGVLLVHLLMAYCALSCM